MHGVEVSIIYFVVLFVCLYFITLPYVFGVTVPQTGKSAID